MSNRPVIIDGMHRLEAVLLGAFATIIVGYAVIREALSGWRDIYGVGIFSLQVAGGLLVLWLLCWFRDFVLGDKAYFDGSRFYVGRMNSDDYFTASSNRELLSGEPSKASSRKSSLEEWKIFENYAADVVITGRFQRSFSRGGGEKVCEN